MLGDALALTFILIALTCAVLLVVTRPERPPAKVYECGECAHVIDGPRCHVVEHDEDPMTGEGFAMVADFHPGCCPVIDPAHVHAS
jgi:hypothetical protein